jgi:hypothetical protein
LKGFSEGGVITDINKIMLNNGDDVLMTAQKKETVMPKEFTNQLPEAIKTMDAVANTNVQNMLSDLTKVNTSNLSSVVPRNMQPSVNVYNNSPLISADKLDSNLLYELDNNKEVQRKMEKIVLGQLWNGAYNAGSRR